LKKASGGNEPNEVEKNEIFSPPYISLIYNGGEERVLLS
jgi:hypothetical protein